jgi:choline dehydrogenase-like flavoprotein
VLIDARSISPDRKFECDLCVVGAGFAGIAIADRLRDSGLSVVLLESGGFNVDLRTQNLYHGETQGDEYFRLDACRWRLFGGGGNRWGGWCRPLEAVDFTQRDWLAHSGWPINAETLRPYEEDAAKLLELPNARFDLEAWRGRLPEPFALDGTHFGNTIFQHSPETNFGEVYRARVLAAANVTTIIHANLTQIRLDADTRRVGELNVATLTGPSFTVRPKAVVLAAGGIENARLLLASRADRVAGLGNEFDLVGRYFMEHLHVPVGHMLAAAGSGNNDFFGKAIFDDVRLRGVITPTAAAQDRYRFPATSIAVESASYSLGTPFVGWPPRITFGPVRCYRVLRNARFNRVAKRLKQLVQGAHAVPMKVYTWKLSRMARSRAVGARGSDRVYSLYFRSEQAPHPTNRVMLSQRRDALGIPESRLEWRVKPQDTASIMGWLEVLDRDVRARGLGRLVAPPDGWQHGITGGPHHMGTTRMAADPHHGVVDADCRVHTVDNLYIAGSSVFATGGYANPTFTLVTLALRLADTLRKRLRERVIGVFSRQVSRAK